MKLKKQMGQLYRVPLTEEAAIISKVGHFVFTGHSHDDTIIGFVNQIDKKAGEMEICLFHPRVLPDATTRVVQLQLSDDEITAMLKSICDEDPAAKEAWISAAFIDSEDDEYTIN